MKEKVSIKLWLFSLLIFLGVLAVSGAVDQGGANSSILDHQAAGTAERVNEIQTQWKDKGVRSLAIIAVACDLAWIWIYALGSFLAGRGFATKRGGLVRSVGLVIAASGILFGIFDYAETILQFMQLLGDVGNDQFAGIAAFAQPIKIATFLIAFVGIIIALLLDRFTKSAPA